MPRSRKFGNTFIQILLLSSLIAITWNVISNYQEQTLRNEILTIRSSLHNLKDTVNKIDTTYDQLYNDITSFVAAENKKLPIDVKYSKISYNKATDNSEGDILFLFEYIDDVNKDKIKHNPPQGTANATTITTTPLVATGVGSEPIKLHQYAIAKCKKVQKSKSKDNIHNHYKNIKSCNCF